MEDYNDAQYCYQDRNSSCRKTSISTVIYVTLYVLISIISAAIAFLNLLVIISISHFKHLHTPTNLLILSLAVSDLLVGLIVIPAMTAAIMEPCWVLGRYYCALLLFVNILSSTSSLCNLVLISIDRYVAVSDPLVYHSKIPIRRTVCCIFINWFCCVINDAFVTETHINIQVPSRCIEECFFAKGDFLVRTIDTAFSLVIPFSIIIILYLKIFAVIVIFWNPLIYVFVLLAPSSNVPAFVITFLPLVNSLINPIIYAFFYPWFKVTAKNILKCRHL